MKHISMAVYTPHNGWVRKSFKSARLARVWAKGIVSAQPCGYSVCQITGWRGGKFIDIPNPSTKAWHKAMKG